MNSTCAANIRQGSVQMKDLTLILTLKTNTDTDLQVPHGQANVELVEHD